MSQGENIAVVVGYVTAPELSCASNGAAVLKFRVAANEWVGSGDKRRQRTDWIPVCIWGNYAEALGRNLTKGQLVSVSGKLRAWRGRDGTTCFHVEGDKVSLLGSRKDRGAEGLPWDQVETDASGSVAGGEPVAAIAEG